MISSLTKKNNNTKSERETTYGKGIKHKEKILSN